MDKILNAKTQWIDSLFAVSKINKEDARITFITNFGYVVGRQFEPVELDFSDEITIQDTMSKAIKDGKNIDNISSAEAFYLQQIKINEQNGFQYSEGMNLRVYVKDAKIYSHSNPSKPVDCEMLILFSDQIVGVIPGEIR